MESISNAFSSFFSNASSVRLQRRSSVIAIRRTVSMRDRAEKEHSLIAVLLPNVSVASKMLYVSLKASLTGNSASKVDFPRLFSSLDRYCLTFRLMVQ